MFKKLFITVILIKRYIALLEDLSLLTEYSI